MKNNNVYYGCSIVGDTTLALSEVLFSSFLFFISLHAQGRRAPTRGAGVNFKINLDLFEIWLTVRNTVMYSYNAHNTRINQLNSSADKVQFPQ